MYVWYNTALFQALIIMGLIPIGLAILTFPLEKLKGKLPSTILRWISIIASVLVTLVSVGLLAFLIIGPRTGDIEPAKLNLINPANPIIAQAASGEPTISSGGASGATDSQNTAAGAAGSATQAAGGARGVGGTGDTGSVAPKLRLSFSSDAHWGVDTSNASARTEILQGIAARRPDAFFFLGDMTEYGFEAMHWNLALSDLEALIPTVPFRPIMGNHDALFGGQYNYKRIFFPKGFASDSGSPYYYSIDAGAARIIVLDMPWGTEQFGKRQHDWLETTLKNSDPKVPIIVLSHSYYYASGYRDPKTGKPWYDNYQTIPAVTPLFEKYGVNLVVSGHNHYQEFLQHNGVSYAIIGAMGGISDPPPTYHSPASKWMAVATFGWLDVDVRDKDLVLTFRNEKGEALHTETIAYK
jgi:UDP-2,3-diacylglucosamine pyrophosphatase LpxH